jgi:type I restriction enzyme S subunit
MEKELPKGWVNIILEDLYFHVTGGDWGLDPQTENAAGFSKAMCIRGGELRNWRVDKGKTASIRLIKDTSINTRKLKIGDILLEISGGGPDQPVGRTVIIDEEVFKNYPELPKICTNFLRLLRLVDNVNKEYVNQYLQYFYTSGEVVKYQGGSNNLRNLKFGDYSSIKIPLPSLPEQQRIVAKLDTLFGHLDAMKTRLERIPQLLKEFRQKVLTQAVTGKLTEDYNNIENWDLVSIDRLVGSIRTDIRTGPFGSSLNKSEHQLDGIPVWGIESISKKGEFTGQNKIFITQAKAKELKSFEVLGGDIIISRSGTVGELCLLPNDISFGIISTNLMKISLNKKVINPTFFCYQFKGSQELLYKLQELCSGSTRLFLTQSILNKLVFVLPPIEEQQEIVRRVESLFAKADQIEAGYQKLKAKIDQLPQALLAKAFRGELVPQLPTDGDARELLEQIKRAKEGLEKGGKGKKMKVEDELRMVAEDGARYGKK